MYRCYEAKRFKVITQRILLSLLFLRNIRNIRFCLRKKVIKKHYLNINHEITRLSSLTTRNSQNSSFTYCQQKSLMLCFATIFERKYAKRIHQKIVIISRIFNFVYFEIE